MATGSFVSQRARPATTISHGIAFSDDRRRVFRSEVEVPLKKRARPSTAHNEDVSTLAPSWDAFSDDYTPSFAMGEGLACEESIVEISGKRKRFPSDDPMQTFRQVKQQFLDEMLRHEGLGSDMHDPCCASCDAIFDDAKGLIKCEDCGVFLECASCCVQRHRCLPHHHIQRWNGRFWDNSASLSELGLVYQLGHGGLECPAPSPRNPHTAMTLITPTCITRVAISYCGCSRSSNSTRVQQLLREGWFPATTIEPNTCATFAALDHFDLLAVIANVNVRDFVSTLECAGDALHLGKRPDVYKAFGCMSRQWGFLQRMKRAGRAHDDKGIDGTAEGEAAVRCWACPRDGINMPPGWRDTPQDKRFVHTLFLSNDANFRMKNRLRRNARPDGPLGPGFGCIVEPARYRDYLATCTSEADVSTCISFAALLEKNTKMTTGCRVSGAGATSCSRHECIRPTGFGDLQKGERYANMDYIFWSALSQDRVDNVTVTYDIGCQWKVHLNTRLLAMPEHLRFHVPNVNVRLPVWHGNVHEVACRSANSVRYAKGAGKVDGEGPERICASMNSIAYATKEMGAGVHEDTIERFSSHHNAQKNASLGSTLERRYVLARQQSALRKAELDEIENDLSDETLAGWQTMYSKYEEDDKAPNPFMAHVAAPPTEQAVKAQLAHEEADAARRGKAPVRATSKATFISAALLLEEQQRRITALAQDVTVAAIERQRNLQEARLAWFKRLARFRHLQELYMPGAVLKIRAEDDARPPDAPPPDAEEVRLWLPSDMTRQEREEGCVEGLDQIEVRLRVAQATDALKKIREQMFAKQYLVNQRNTHIVGQRDSTHARRVIDRVGDHINQHKDKYRKARTALHRLESRDAYPAFKELKDSDLALDDDREADGASTDRLATVGARGAKVVANARKVDVPATRQDREIAAVRQADSRRSLTSWIWTCLGGPVQDENAQVYDALRVEWAKARARRERWAEEVQILEEEMRRVLRHLQWTASSWEARADRLPSRDAALQAGLRAYALRQAALTLQVEASFKVRWEVVAPHAMEAPHGTSGLPPPSSSATSSALSRIPASS
ncbi:hypothetical protein FB107DRAFT_221498 [Schizophyllum commune]